MPYLSVLVCSMSSAYNIKPCCGGGKESVPKPEPVIFKSVLGASRDLDERACRQAAPHQRGWTDKGTRAVVMS